MDFPSSHMYHWGEPLQLNNPSVGQLFQRNFLAWNRCSVELGPTKAVPALWVQLPSPVWLVQADPSWNLGPCITQQQLLLVSSTSSHCLPWRLCSHWQTLLHRVKHGVSGGLLGQGRARTAVALSLDSGSRSWWYVMRQRSGERTQEWFGMKSISFSELDRILTPVTEYQQMACISSEMYANWSF